MDRNFSIRKCFPSMPTRSCLNRTGPLLSSFTSTATSTMAGDAQTMSSAGHHYVKKSFGDPLTALQRGCRHVDERQSGNLLCMDARSGNVRKRRRHYQTDVSGREFPPKVAKRLGVKLDARGNRDSIGTTLSDRFDDGCVSGLIPKIGRPDSGSILGPSWIQGCMPPRGGSPHALHHAVTLPSGQRHSAPPARSSRDMLRPCFRLTLRCCRSSHRAKQEGRASRREGQAQRILAPYQSEHIRDDGHYAEQP